MNMESQLNKHLKENNMKPQIFKVCLYYGGEMPNEQRYTPSIDVARKWVTEAEHGTIENQNNILIQ